MPIASDFNGEPQLLGASDEACLTSQWATTWHYSKIVNLGTQTAKEPIYNYWSNKTSISQPARSKAYDLYGGIRQCYTFLGRLDNVPGVSADEKTLWIAESKFLIAYYHYSLLRLYGPIIIVEGMIESDAPEDIYLGKRNPYDECVSWISNLLDEATTNLPLTAEMGRPTQVVAKSIKARMLLYAASALFNGNSEYYANFKNKSGEHLINQSYDKEKWKKALDATEEAINLAHSAGHSLFAYPSTPTGASVEEKAYLDARYMTVMFPSEGNKDMIWAYSGTDCNLQQMMAARGISNKSTTLPYGGISPSFQMVETFLTKKGLPIDKDPDYDYTNRYMPAQDGVGEWIAKGHLNREPRFYANVAYDRAANYELNEQTGSKAYTLYLRMGEKNPKTNQTNANEDNKDSWAVNGYLFKKFVHPNSNFENNNAAKRKMFAYPLIRLTELYLNYAEAYYEYNGTLSSKGLTYFNQIRTRAGIPDVDAAWAGIAGKDYREIIRQERTIELMFEGHRFFDARRWKTAHLTFATHQNRWNCFQAGFTNASPQPYTNYLQIKPSAEATKSFETKHYLYPIDIRDINTNPNLVQNPDW